MSDRSSDSVFAEAVRRLRDAEVLLLITHARPDGDGLGSLAALGRAAAAAGKTARLLIPDQIPSRYEFLFSGPEGDAALYVSCGPGPRLRVKRPSSDAGDEGEEPRRLFDDADAIVILDTSAYSQLDGLEEWLRLFRDKVMVIDHHATGDPVGALAWIDPPAAACGVMVGELIEALGWPVDVRTAEALTVAVATDTGWMRFSNTDSRALRRLATWLDQGVRFDRLYRTVYQTDRPERLRLMARMLAGLELHCGGRLATMVLSRSDFAATGARSDETENLVNEAMRIGSVEVALLLVENAELVRVNLRSREAVDVAAIAQRFGGGGHKRAAGLRSQEDIGALRSRLIETCAEALGEAGIR